MKKIFTICGILIISPFWISGQTTQNEKQFPNLTVTKSRSFTPFRKKPSKEQKIQLQPKEEDLKKYSQFLLQPNTGIFRLVPDSGCDDNAMVLRVDENCRNAIPDSAHYSFRENEHTADWLADIRLKNEILISDGLLMQGIFVKLGDIPVETVMLESEGMKFIGDYVPQISGKEANKQFRQLVEGIRLGKYEYKKAVEAMENTTYGFRVIAYRGNLYRSYRGYIYDLLDGDERKDLTLVFRIIRKESDGSLTLLWKELQTKESPKVKFHKKSK